MVGEVSSQPGVKKIRCWRLLPWGSDALGASLCLVAVGCLAGCGGAGSSSQAQVLPPSNPAPSLATGSLSPSSTVAGGTSFLLTVNGSNFISSSVVEWNGNTRTTSFVSSSSLQATITGADIATAGTAQISVSTPGPGGGTASGLAFTVDNPAPSVVSLNPNSAFGGNASFTLTVSGANFVSSSTVQWNGTPRTTTFISNTTLQAAITDADISAVGTGVVTVSNPAPGGGTSASLTFTIKPPPPAITLLNPSSAVAGGTNFMLTVTGKNFVNSSAVQWNGSARTTTFVSSTQLQAAVTAADISGIGVTKVTVANPLSSGGVSASSTFFVGTTGGANFAAIAVNQAAQDIVYDPVNAVFYLSVTGTAITHPNTISVLNPATATITSSQAAGSNPNVLAISDDNQFLYAGIDGAASVQRFMLPNLVKDISYSLGAGSPGISALDLQVAPGASHTTAVEIGNRNFSPSCGPLAIFDDAVQRPTTASNGLFCAIQWGSDATQVYAMNNDTSGFDFYTLSVNSNGVVVSQDFVNGIFSGRRIHFDRSSDLIYSDGGDAVSTSGAPVGSFNTSGVMAEDPGLNKAFFPTLISGGAVTIQSFDLTRFTAVGSITIPNVLGNPLRLVRWGQNGLAFNTDNGQVFLVGGNFLDPQPIVPPPGPLPPPPPPPPPPTAQTPTISILSPSSAIAGNSGFILNVNGTNFTSGSTVQFNGSARVTTFVSSTQLRAAIGTADIASPGVAQITAVNPANNGGASVASTFFIGSTGGTSTGGAAFAVTVLSQVSTDIVSDPVRQAIYLSVPNTDPDIGNTVSALDLASGTIGLSQFAGSNPRVLAISDDGQFLYAGIDGSASVQRFTLPSLAKDIIFSLGRNSFFGPYFAKDIQVAPGMPRTTAVTSANAGFSPSAQGGISIFDDASARPTKAGGFSAPGGGLFDSLQWGADATVLFAINNEDSGFDFYTLSVNTNGVTLTQDFLNSIGSARRIHFDSGTKLIYSDNGRVVDSAGNLKGNFNSGGVMVPDSTLNRAFCVSSGSGSATITSFDLTTFSQVDAMTIPNVPGTAQRLIRWGQNGLAFNTDGGQVFLIGGNFVH